jgi:RNA polymerase sigma-70 factor (ECF subfamily)
MTLQECQSISDLELLERIRNGETGLYELIMRRYNQRLFRVIRSVVQDDREAEDVLQEAWVRVYEHLDQFAGRASLATWLTRVAFHEALSRARKGKRWAPLEDETGEIMSYVNRQREPSATPEALAIQNQLGQILQSAVDGLSDTYRSVFVLRDVEGMGTTETAECLELSEEAVKTRLHRARAMLRHDLQTRIGPAIAETFLFMGARCDRTVIAVLDRIGASRVTLE